MARKRKTFRKRSREEWRGIVAEYRESGLTQREFVAKAGVSLSSLARWHQRFAHDAEVKGPEPVPVGWVELVRQEPSTPLQIVTEPMRLLVGRGVCVELGELPPPDYIALVARAYEAVPSC